MAIWAIAWAGSKPVASLSDGVLARSIGIKWTGVALAAPALIPIAALLALPVLVLVIQKWKPEQEQFSMRKERLTRQVWFRQTQEFMSMSTPSESVAEVTINA